ncbi:MAG: LytR/AlgR family response regulator transcription factor [Bacteroidia bacterium]
MKNKYKAIIIDDEIHARAAIRGIVEENFKKIEIIAEAKDLPTAVKIINKEKPDLIFLDVEMPGHSGLELLDFFNDDDISFEIIFVTAYQEYAINAFKLAAVDYLLKPVKVADLEKAIELFERKYLKQEKENNLKVLHTLKRNLQIEKPETIVLPTSDGLIIENLKDIVYIKAEGSYVNIIFSNKTKIMLAKKLMDYEYLEHGFGFLRIHRSFIINIKHVKKILKGDSTVIMSNGDELSITPDKRQHLLEILTYND